MLSALQEQVATIIAALDEAEDSRWRAEPP